MTYDGIDGSAAWKHTELFPPCYLAFTDGTWFVQTEAAMRNSSGVGALCLDDADCVSPDTVPHLVPGRQRVMEVGELNLSCAAQLSTQLSSYLHHHAHFFLSATVAAVGMAGVSEAMTQGASTRSQPTLKS